MLSDIFYLLNFKLTYYIIHFTLCKHDVLLYCFMLYDNLINYLISYNLLFNLMLQVIYERAC
jgi:hypothetical protein